MATSRKSSTFASQGGAHKGVHQPSRENTPTITNKTNENIQHGKIQENSSQAQWREPHGQAELRYRPRSSGRIRRADQGSTRNGRADWYCNRRWQHLPRTQRCIERLRPREGRPDGHVRYGYQLARTQLSARRTGRED